MAFLKLLAPLAVALSLSAHAQSDTPPPSSKPDLPPSCSSGALKQGGLLLCHGEPGTLVRLDGMVVAKFDEQGRASVGLRTTTPKQIAVTLDHQGQAISEVLTIDVRHDETSKIYPQDCDKVSPRTKEQIEHIQRSSVKKVAAFKEFHTGDGFFKGVVRPVPQADSSPFNKLREYICKDKDTGKTVSKPGSPHGGHDFRSPTGTPLAAPAGGVVLLADPDLYFEGGAIFLDHGMGLVSVFMHMSEIDVKAGDVVNAGDIIGKTGNTGRTTGPHLHWSVKWRNTTTDNRGGDFYIDPALIMALE